MILQTGFRTDIPGFYSTWFANRLRAGFVLVRNPYDPQSVTRYAINPDVVDLIGFCTKNPAPMLPRMELLRPYGQYWFVTITPYGPEIEPHVPPKAQVLQDFITLSKIVGPDCIAWRYDPIFLSDTYTAARHIAEFEQMAAVLSGYTRICVISFIDLYEKVRRNFPQVKSVPLTERETLGKAFVEIGKKYGMMIPLRRGHCAGPLWCRLQRLHDATDFRGRAAPSSAVAPAKASPQGVRLLPYGGYRCLQYLRSRLPILLRQLQPCDCSAEYAYAQPRFTLFGRAQPSGRCDPRGKAGKLAGRSDQYG